MRDLPLLFITNPDVPDTAFNEKALEKPSIDDTEEKKFWDTFYSPDGTYVYIEGY